MKKKNKKNHIRMRFSTLLLCCLAFVLCAAPALQADKTVQPGDIEDIDYEVTGILWVKGTANLLPGASAQHIYVYDEGTLNIYSGTAGCSIFVCTGAAGMTVYGMGFEDEMGPVGYGQWKPDGGRETLTGQYGQYPDSGEETLTSQYDQYKDGSTINLLILSDTPINLEPPPSSGPEEITIDIKPGSDLNNINLKSRGVVPVAVLTLTTDGTTDGFDAGDVDPDTVEFAGTKPIRPIRWKLCDVDGDGDLDRLFHFDTQELFKNDLNEDSTDATLTGKTKDGIGISGTDTVRIVPQKKKK